MARQIRLGVVPAGTILTPRPKEIPAWDSLNNDQKKVYARMMEVYAANVAESDYENRADYRCPTGVRAT